MSAVSVSVEKDGPIWVVTIERPEVRNAVDRRTAEELADAFRAFEADDDARVAVLCGRGEHFCAGADLKAIAKGEPNRLAPTGDAPLGPTRMLLSKPVIAAIAGYAVAGGLELAIWCDLRVVEQSAVMGCLERRWGVPLIDGGTVRLPRLIGLGRALDLILTGRPISADEALQMGLATRVVDDGTSREVAVSIGLQIASFPQRCMRSDRRSVYQQFGLPLAEALAQEFELGQDSLTQETFEGATRFTQGKGRHGSFDEG